ncbi:hypothetical protein [Variovorax sp. RA8]|uniref:hypothetical protein n=1 Tax=Variovorax sp. (strain JCM 16519 / RA8) TaxID=662548 RepID=UPI000AB8EB10|nr:hypothetical protein [Variovorax sp. RA8]
MRTFNEVYSELQHYSAFKAEPSTESEAITSTNAFFAELALDDDTDATARFADLVKCYTNSARHFFICNQTDRRTFKSFLENVYEIAKHPFLLIDTPKSDYSQCNDEDEWQKEMARSIGGDVNLGMKALYDHGRWMVDSSERNESKNAVTFKGHRIGVDGILSSLPIVRTTKSLMNNDKKMAEGTLHQDIKAKHYPNMKQRKSS